MNHATEKRLAQRVETGIPGFDTILKGGLLNAGVYMIRGTPGAGKTTLASQISFYHAAQGSNVLYVTLLSESHARLVQHLRAFTFFSEESLSERFALLSAFAVLEAEGPGGVAKLLAREVLKRRATLLILDGLSNVDDSAQSEREMKKFIAELQSYALAQNCTMLLLTSGSRELTSPEYTMVDGVIELDLLTRDMRTQRTLQVRKLRGTDSISGCHYFDLTEHGVTLFPRLDTVFTKAPPPLPIPRRRVSTTVASLDVLTGGGLPQASTTLLLGPTGSGKTSLGLHFVSGSTPEEPGLLCGFYESPSALIAKAASIGIDLATPLASGALEIMWQPAYDVLMDAVCYRWLESVAKRNVKRLFIDGIGALEQTAFMRERIQPTLSAMANALRSSHVTTLYSWETPDLVAPHLRAPHSELSTITDNMLMLRHLEVASELRRLIAILKMRDSTFDASLHQYEITNTGVHIRGRVSIPGDPLGHPTRDTQSPVTDSTAGLRDTSG